MAGPLDVRPCVVPVGGETAAVKAREADVDAEGMVLVNLKQGL
jgi:hypothetical protein